MHDTDVDCRVLMRPDATHSTPSRNEWIVRPMIDLQRTPWLTWAALLVLLAVVPVAAADSPEAAAKAAPEAAKPARPAAETPLATFLTVTSPVEDVMSGRIRTAALSLQHRAVQQDRPAVLVLQITPGSSEFHHIQGLAKFLTSAELSKVKTVAWIDDRVTGNNVVLALACNEIIMHPDAELGDIGRGKALDPDEQQAVINLVEKRTNPKVNRALALAMMDPQEAVLKVKIRLPNTPENAAESRIVTQEELQRLRKNKAMIFDVETVKETGVIGTFTGSQARALGVLAVQTADSRAEVAGIYNLPQGALREDATAGVELNVQRIQIDGMIEPILESFLKRQIDRAVASGANMIIFEIDSPGGYLVSSTNLAFAIADLDPKKVRTVAYIPREALSGAAIIALGCDEIYMTPEANFGDAGPIELQEGGAFERAPEKVLSPLKETLKTLADKKNRPAALCEAMADKDLEVYKVRHRETGRVWYMSESEIHASNGEWIKGRMVPESREGMLLTVNGQRAHELKLAGPPVEDFDALKLRLGIPANAELAAVGRTWVDTLVFVLNTRWATFLMFVAGAAFIYLELYTMTGMFGIASAVCFSLFFWSRFLGGTAGWLEVVFFVLGIVLIGLEIFVIPGFGVFGVSGGLLMLVGLILASQTFVIPQSVREFGNLTSTLGTVMASVLSVIVLAVVLSRFLPRLPLLNQMILSPPDAPDERRLEEPQLRPDLSGTASASLAGGGKRRLLGRQGTTSSVLRPAGKAWIGDELVDVVSDGPYIDAGSPVEVVEVTGNRVVVRQTDV